PKTPARPPKDFLSSNLHPNLEIERCGPLLPNQLTQPRLTALLVGFPLTGRGSKPSKTGACYQPAPSTPRSAPPALSLLRSVKGATPPTRASCSPMVTSSLQEQR